MADADGGAPKGEPLSIVVKDATGGEVQVRGVAHAACVGPSPSSTVLR